MELVKENNLPLIISYYDDQSFIINEIKYTSHLYISSTGDIRLIDSSQFVEQKIIVFTKSFVTVPEILLIGTGRNVNHLLMMNLMAGTNTYPFEIMNTSSAIRTFNVIKSEGRKIEALLQLNT